MAVVVAVAVALERAVAVRVVVAKVVAVAMAIEWCLANAVAVDMAVEVVRPKHVIPFWKTVNNNKKSYTVLYT